MAGDDAVQLGQRLDLVDDDAAHLGGAFGGLLRQLEDAAAQFGAGRLKLALHLGSHLPHALERLGEALRGLREHLVRLGGVLRVDAVQLLAGALAFLFQRTGAIGARVGDDAGDLAGAAGGAIERLIEQAREALEPLLDVVGSRVERADQRFDPRPAFADGGVGMAVALVDQRDRFGERATVRVELKWQAGRDRSAPCW